MVIRCSNPKCRKITSSTRKLTNFDIGMGRNYLIFHPKSLHKAISWRRPIVCGKCYTQWSNAMDADLWVLDHWGKEYFIYSVRRNIRNPCVEIIFELLSAKYDVVFSNSLLTDLDVYFDRDDNPIVVKIEDTVIRLYCADLTEPELFDLVEPESIEKFEKSITDFINEYQSELVQI